MEQSLIDVDLSLLRERREKLFSVVSMCISRMPQGIEEIFRQVQSMRDRFVAGEAVEPHDVMSLILSSDEMSGVEVERAKGFDEEQSVIADILCALLIHLAAEIAQHSGTQVSGDFDQISDADFDVAIDWARSIGVKID